MMMASKKAPQKIEQVQKDVRNVMFFIFFALTVGAGSGLLGHLHSAFNTEGVAMETQLSAVYIPGVDKPAEIVYDLRGGVEEQGYQVEIDTGEYLQYFPEHHDYYVRTACTPAEGCNSWYRLDGPYGEEEEFTIGMKEVINNSGWDIVDYLNLVRREDDHKISASPYQPYPATAEQFSPLTPKGQDSQPARDAPAALGSPSDADALPSIDAASATPTVVDNRCSTTYVTMSAIGAPITTDCYGTKDDKARRYVENLAACIVKQDTSVTTIAAYTAAYEALKPKVAAGMCQGPKAETTKAAGGSVAILKNGDEKIIYRLGLSTVPGACKKQYDDLVGLMGGLNGTTALRAAGASATGNDARACAWKGAAVCYQTNPNDPNSIVCKHKADVAIEKIDGKVVTPAVVELVPTADPIRTPTPTTGPACKGITCFFNNLLKDGKIKDQIGKLVKNWIMGNKNGCPKGYVRTGSTTTGTTTTATCAPEPKAVLPQCVMATQKTTVASGESVLLRWKTADADTVGITGVADSVATTGEATVAPYTTTTYVLTAKNSDGEKQCETTVRVDGRLTGPSGAHPPQLSCSPEKVEQGATASISWSCGAPATDSAGEGVATRGALSGSVDITPESSSLYVVKCFNEDEEIGRNVCAVDVGNPQYDIIAYPSSVAAGERTRISWASLFMKSCHVTGPRGFNYTHTQGVVVTEPFDKRETGTLDDAVYTLECVTEFGDTVSKEVIVSGN